MCSRKGEGGLSFNKLFILLILVFSHHLLVNVKKSNWKKNSPHFRPRSCLVNTIFDTEFFTQLMFIDVISFKVQLFYSFNGLASYFPRSRLELLC